MIDSAHPQNRPPAKASRFRIRRLILAVVLLAGVIMLAALVSAPRWVPAAIAGGLAYTPNHRRPPDPAGDPGPEALRRLGVSRQERFRVGAPPASLSVWIIDPPPAAGPPRSTVFVLHGIRDRKEHLLGLGRALAADGHRTVLVDLRGHGRSEGDWLSYGVRESADLAALLDVLSARALAVGPLGAVGPSYGAATAIQWAGRDGRLAAVAAVAPFTSLREATRDYLRRYLPGVGTLIPDRLVDAGIDAAGRRAGFDPDEASPLAAIRRTTAPVLLVHGREDRNIPCTHSVRLQAAAPPGSRLVLLDGEDHFSITRSGSERTRREIRTWFRRWLAAAPRPPGAPGAVVSAGRDVVQHPQPPIQAGSAAMNLTDRERVVRILQANRSHAFLATSSDSQPYCRVVAPLVEDDLAIWIATFQGSRKVGQIQHNARVCLSFLEIPGYTREANVYGEAAIVTDPASKRRVWSLAAGELARYFPAGPDSEVFCLLRVTARRVEWREGDGPGYRILTIP